MIVTRHAAERYVERINPRLTIAEATAAIEASRRVVELAAEFGCHLVRQGCGAGLVLRGSAVVTVIAKGCYVRSHQPERANEVRP